ncbi:hypothetical protein [Allomuricauda sp. NBRC 101325]|uniref:hypothetical protein n=1 Tax=Allomuricauda sp. NBRC 101325 TaxID=1113758 RepID=UPI00249FDA5A|nr:hypothetical protein [Muricauda sp. NBRC 101325]GLU42612.1 hypothetical protein Musp01_02360 [Muricauda sp. NBRC 101325]
MTQNNRIFSKLFEDAYASPKELAEVLQLGVEMLFYVEEGSFSRTEIQNVARALNGIRKELGNCNRT